MITHPSAAELARAVARWIDEVRSQLDSRNAYLARVAINALGIVDRELLERDRIESEITPRLSKLLNQAGDYDSLARELCARLRRGDMNITTPGLLEMLKDDTLARLAIDQPTYRHETSTSTKEVVSR
jgi:hypothetical protein